MLHCCPDTSFLRKVNTIYLEHIAKNTQPAEALLKDTAAETKAVLVVGFNHL